MYNEFYGLKENPFELTPDPQFLFLSDKHSDALKYLIYGIQKRKGFILITGEVGTGKTTLCRYLLSELGDDIKTAMLLNPSFSEKEMLEAILVEFGLDISSIHEKKELLNLLNQFLLKQLTEGKNAAVIIDEAQNLPPQILEQLRILSNLETNKEKLIQIILVGQPELDAKLNSPELRQLGQRIALRFHLKHLSLEETKEYINHRLSIAGSKGDIQFTSRAIHKIYKASNGYPRSINVLCDQALMAGCFAMTRKITPGLVKLAIKNIRGWRASRSILYSAFSKGVLSAASIILVLFFLGLLTLRGGIFSDMFTMGERIAESKAEEIPSSKDKLQGRINAQEKRIVHAQTSSIVENLHTVYAGKNYTPAPQREKNMPGLFHTRNDLLTRENIHRQGSSLCSTAKALFQEIGSYDVVCMAIIFRMWGMPIASIEEIRSWMGSSGELFSFWTIARNYGFSAAKITQSLRQLRKLNVPCILMGFYNNLEMDLPHSVVLAGIAENNVTIIDPRLGKLILPIEDFSSKWSGKSILVWKESLALPRVIMPGMTGHYVESLERRLRELGYFQGMAPFVSFNQDMKRAVEHFQRMHELKVDGIVGPITQFILQRSLNKGEFPTLNSVG